MTRFVGYAALMASAFSNSLVNGQASPPLATDNGVTANIFDMSQITLNEGRWHENQNRTLNYIKFVDPERMLYVFRQTHGLSTKSATPNGGWDAPDFPFRSHVQGHLLSAWAQCYSQLKDTQCRDKAVYFVKELAKCQANNAAVGFSAGYLSGFPESQFDRLNAGSDISGNVPYYAVHKTMQGLLDVWRHIGSTEARDVLLALAGWVDAETKPMSYTQMQRVLQTEFGGMNDILADIYRQTKDSRWIDVAKRFDHAAVFNPLAANTDNLNGLHANTQVPKWIGAAREYKATGNTTYLNIARNAFRMTTSAHTYAIGGNSQAEHFRPPNAIAGYLTTDTCEHCNTYNMLRLAKELWTIDPLPEYFDFYERALLNHLLGAQKHDDHGHITYFTPLKAGGKRGVGPAWGGGTWSTDHNSFWCCQGTGWEQNTKLNDAIYGHTGDALYVNLFAPSKVTWGEKKVTVQQVTNYPVDGKTTLKVQNAGTFKLNIRIPSWANNAEISINGKKENVAAAPGTYASISRTWAANDEVVVTLPMKARLVQANDNQSLAAIAYGPTILCGNYGSTAVSNTPTIDLSTLQKASSSALRFTAKVGGQTVNLEPFYDAQEFNYVVYWSYTGTLG